MPTPSQELQQLFTLLATPGQATLRLRSIISGSLTIIAVDPSTSAQTPLTFNPNVITDILLTSSLANWANSSTLSDAVSNGFDNFTY